MPREEQREWPRQRPSDGTERTSPRAMFVTSDGYLRIDRSVSGPLRIGTEKRVGPRGALRDGGSDFGVDRVSPRRFDPIGTHDERAPARESSELVSKETRRSRKDD